MSVKIPIDLHSHTNRSFDGNNSATEMAAQAHELGIGFLALTDHCEMNEYFSESYANALKNSYIEAREADLLYKDVTVLAGIEIGQAFSNYEMTDRILASREYDFVLSSIHSLPNMKDFYFLSYTAESADYLLVRYFDELYRMVQWGNFDSVAHLTYPIRYISGNCKIPIDLNKYSNQIDHILRLMIEKNKALEINTSGYHQKLKDSVPNVSIVKRFRELGGKYITIGSDAHSIDALGKGVDKGIEVAKSAGFEHVTVFKKRQPQLIKLP